MPLSGLLLILVVGAVVYRAMYFIIEDSLFDGTRDKLKRRVAGPDKGYISDEDGTFRHNRALWRSKLLTLMSCPYCQGPYLSAAAFAGVDWFTEVPVHLPVLSWLAATTVSLACWRFIEHN